ncbi:hypothetical protein M9Y10_033928 [Tritrichomonas musculus]|uniref:Uncharacterized protein n=1 Tax=Tritrichomonas musculus TaxID=1915356 RepID=A0ABR2KE63_9EUKA
MIYEFANISSFVLYVKIFQIFYMNENDSKLPKSYEETKKMILEASFELELPDEFHQTKIIGSNISLSQLTKAPINDESYLISNNSKILSNMVSNISVLDRLTCDYLIPEARKCLRRSKSFSDLGSDDHIQELRFSSSILSEIFPNTISFSELMQYMMSPQHKVRIRGQIPSFEKIVAQLNYSKKLHKNKSIDLTDFFKRDEELLEKKKRLANPKPPRVPKFTNESSKKIIKNAEKKKELKEIKSSFSPVTPKATSKKFSKIEPNQSQTKSANSYSKSKFRLAQTAEQMANINKTRKEIAEFEEKNRKKEKLNDENRCINYLTPGTVEKAQRAEIRRKEKALETCNSVIITPKKEKKRKYSRKMPNYISEIASFISEQRIKEAEKTRLKKIKNE